MKKLLFLFGLSLLIFACKNEETSVEPISKLDFSVKMLDSGRVEITNLSKNVKELKVGYRWVDKVAGMTDSIISNDQLQYLIGSYRDFGKDNKLELNFLKNGNFQLCASALYDDKDSYKIIPIYKQIPIEIKSVPESFVATKFTGSYLGENVTLKSNTLNGFYTSPFYGDELSGSLVDQKNGSAIFLSYNRGFNPNNSSLEQKRAFFKTAFKLGSQKIWTFGTEMPAWRVNGYFYESGKVRYDHSDPNAELEILSIEEVTQKPLFDGMMNEAFWVTFKIKADFKEKGKVDGVLKVKYFIY